MGTNSSDSAATPSVSKAGGAETFDSEAESAPRALSKARVPAAAKTTAPGQNDQRGACSSAKRLGQTRDQRSSDLDDPYTQHEPPPEKGDGKSVAALLIGSLCTI